MFYLTSCKDKIEQPDGGFSWYEETDFMLNRDNPNKNPFYLNETAIFVSESNDAEMYVVWPGDKGYDYTKRFLHDSLSNADTNKVASKAAGKPLTFKNGEYYLTSGHVFSDVGTFMVYFVSRNFNEEDNSFKETVDSAEIEVLDTVTSLFLPQGADPTKVNYSFNVVLPADLAGVAPDISGTLVELPVSYGFDLSYAAIKFAVNNALVTVDQGELSLANGVYTWQGSLESPCIITVSAVGEGAPSKDYTLQATYGTPSSENDLTELSIAGFDGEISGSGVDVELPAATNLNAVAIDFTVSEHATVSIGGTDIASGDDIDLSSPVTLTVTAQDGTTPQDFTITPVGIPTQMTNLEFINLNPVVVADFSATPNIAATVFPGTDVTNLVPSITMTKFAQAFYNDGSSDVQIENGVTAIDFTDPVDLYIYTSVDTVQYTVTVSE